MADVVVIADEPSTEIPVEPVVEVPVVVEVTEDHDVNFAERLVALEIGMAEVREAVFSAQITADVATELATDAVATADAAVDLAIEATVETEAVMEEVTDDTPAPSQPADDAPSSKRHAWFGKAK